MEFDALWLAHNCASLLQPGTGQKLFALASLLPPTTATAATTMIRAAQLSPDGSAVHVQWQEPLPSGASESVFDCAWLESLHVYQRRERRPVPLPALPKADGVGGCRFNTAHLPRVSFPDLFQPGVGPGPGRGDANDAMLGWVEALHDHGICIVDNVPLDMAGSAHDDGSGDSPVVQLGRLLAEPQITLYGQDFDVRQEANPINIAYTNAELDLHMDLAYYESPPGIQMLHCLENDQHALVGGESLLMDVHNCAEIFRSEDPDAFRVLCEVPATFIKDHLERAHPTQMFYRRPHFAVDAASGDVSAVFWSPNFEGPLMADVADVRRYHDAYIKFSQLLQRPDIERAWLHEFSLQPGETVTFNQRRMLHGRRGFCYRQYDEGGGSGSGSAPRHLKGTYVNIDDFLSAFRVLRLQAGRTPRGVDGTRHTGCRST